MSRAVDDLGSPGSRPGPADEASPTHDTRLARWARISSALALLSDEQLTRRVNEAQPLGAGIGGTTMRLDVEGHPVFAKRLRLTDLERRPKHLRSTRNLFGLPAFCQRNVGSVGFGVWRELAAHEMTSGWVISGQLECFPLMYHWRVLDGATAPGAHALPDELADIAGMVRYWEGCEAMGERLRALAGATASVTIFLEHLPWTLARWLERQWAAGAPAAEAACALVEHSLAVDVPRMNALGLQHGDAHHGNLLTDGRRLYLADLGLASSPRFDLSPEEARYLRDHATLDAAYARAKWVNALVQAWDRTVGSPLERMDRVRRIAQGHAVQALIPGLPDIVARSLRRHAPVAACVNDFYARLHGERRDAPYPRDEIEALLQAAA